MIKDLVGTQFFGIEDNRLRNLSSLLDQAGLLFEADVFVYWLFFRRDLSLNPILTLTRTLDSSLTGPLDAYYVQPAQAGYIIGSDRIFERKYDRSLARNVVRRDRSDVQKLVEKLDNFVLSHSTSSFKNRLKALVSEIPPDIIWIEICRGLSKYIKAELKNIQTGSK